MPPENPPLRGAGGCLLRAETLCCGGKYPGPETPPCPPQGGIPMSPPFCAGTRNIKNAGQIKKNQS